MNWIDIAGIVFVCVTANHLGLIKAIETVTNCNRLPIISCPKCFTFWLVLAYLTLTGVVFDRFITALAISFLASYVAIWLELFEGFVDYIYNKVYDTIYQSATDTTSADTDKGDFAGPVSELWQITGEQKTPESQIVITTKDYLSK